MTTYDYIIVGAGSAGCVLANRLSTDPDIKVLLLEAGPPDHGWDWKIHMPAALAHPLAGNKYNWYYESEPDPFMNGRKMYCPRGRVLGGSSSINGMIYVRGNPLDYERWAKEDKLDSWSYAHCLPYFKKAETRDLGADDYHGDGGPLRVTRGHSRNPLFDAFIQAGTEAGYAFTKDVNGYQQEGVGRYDMTTHRGKRWSAARAYLHPVLSRSNLTVETRTLATRILFEGIQATGIEYTRRGQIKQASAVRETIVCGGAINSPQLLMLSGIGKANELKKLDIPVIADLPGVGQNLQDHLEIYVQHECTQPISLYPALKPLKQLRIGIEWYLFKTGLGATNHFEAGGFIRSGNSVAYPDLQYHFLPIAMNYDGSETQETHGFQAHVGPMRPTSVGHVKLKTKDPRDYPSVLFNYMATEGDRQEMRDAVRLTREIIEQKAFDPYRGPELAPGKDIQSDEAIDAFVRAKAESAYHASCTCKMGHDAMAVVDTETKVHGVEKLRVVDASIMPSIISGNLNAPTIMIAEKVADMIAGKSPLAPAQVPFYIASNYSASQR